MTEKLALFRTVSDSDLCLIIFASCKHKRIEAIRITSIIRAAIPMLALLSARNRSRPQGHRSRCLRMVARADANFFLAFSARRVLFCENPGVLLFSVSRLLFSEMAVSILFSEIAVSILFSEMAVRISF
jgi:hypothetical protein